MTVNLVTIATLTILGLVMLTQTEIALAQAPSSEFQSETTKAFNEAINHSAYKMFDVCLPFSQHVHDIVNTTGIKRSCAANLGSQKHLCETPFNEQQPPAACSDPRYVNWLINDYPKYPMGTWDYTNALTGEVVHP